MASMRLLPLPDGTPTPPLVGYADGSWWVQLVVDDAPFRFHGTLTHLLRMYGHDAHTPDATVRAVAALRDAADP